MVEEAPTASETSVTMPQPTETVTVIDGTLNHDKNETPVNATVESAAVSDAATSGPSSDGQKSLDMAIELMEKGNKAMKENDFGEAAENYSRALEIRFDFFPAIIIYAYEIICGDDSL